MDIKRFLKNEGEKPLDNILEGGGFCSLLRTVVCIGDSLSSGEFERIDKDGNVCYHDMYDYSWGQFMARAAGIKVYNYSRGGMTAKGYCDFFADSKGFWNEDVKANAYIIALGVNDANQIYTGDLAFGEISDVNLEDCEKNAKTFVGYYAKIIQRYKKISSDAKFFLVTPPVVENFNKEYERLAEAFYRLAEIFSHTFVIDLLKYGPDYNDADFREAFYLHNHLSPAGYALTGKMICSYIDYIIRNNPKEFKLLAFQNTPLYGEQTDKINSNGRK